MARGKGQKIMVTGAGGQLAQCIKKQLPKNTDDEYFFVSRKDLDITRVEDVGRLFKTFRPDVVINTAAYTQVDRAEGERETAFAINAEAVKTLAEACHEQQALFIHLSTDYVFDGKSRVPYRENDLTNPQAIYGASKRAGEELLMASEIKRFYIIRTSWLYSGFGHNFYKTMLQLANEREELQIVDDQQGSPTNANDLAKGILKIIILSNQNVHKRNDYGIYHFSNGGSTSWYGFARAIFDFKKIDVAIVPISSEAFPTNVKRPVFSVLCNKRFQESFGFKIPHWKESLEGFIRSERINNNGN